MDTIILLTFLAQAGLGLMFAAIALTAVLIIYLMFNENG